MNDPRGEIKWDPINRDSIELVMKSVAGQVGIDPHVLRQAVSVESFMEMELGYLMLRVVGRLYSREIPMSPTYRYPLNWWEAVRKRWCPAWWLRRYPVREEVFVFTGFHDYPGLAIDRVEPRLRIEVLHYTEAHDTPPEESRAD